MNPKKQQQKNSKNASNKTVHTSWTHVSSWYDALVKSSDSYQKNVIFPNIVRLVQPKKQESILDLACGQGLFGGYFSEMGVRVVGVDIAKDLIDIARREYKNAEFYTHDATNLPFLKDNSFDYCIHISAIQNIKDVPALLATIYRVLKPSGVCTIVMNHPAFRPPQKSDWGYDTDTGAQYRKIYGYLSEYTKEIDMNPGEKNIQKKKKTLSFHKPLQWYMKQILKAGFSITKFEEWTSHRESQPGPRKDAEDLARKEIPLFLMLQITK